MIKTECKGTQTLSADQCSVVTDLTCALKASDGTPVTGVYKGTVAWSEDGSRGAGTIELDATVPSAGVSCSSIYDASYTKQ